MKYFIILIYCSLLIGNETNLEKLLSIAFENNLKIQSKMELVSKQKSEAKVLSSLPDPSLSAGYFLTPIETKTGPQEWKIGISQSIPGFGKLASKKKIGLLRAEKEKVSLQKTQLEIQREVITVYEKLRYLQTETSITENLLVILKRLESVLTTQYITASVNHANLIQIQLEVLKQEDNLATIVNEEIILYREMKSLLGGQNPGDIVFDEIELTIPEFKDFAKNPELQTVSISVDIAKTKVHLANLSYLPDFKIGADYIMLDGAVEDNPIDIRFGLTLPLWFGKNMAKKQSAKSELTSTEYLVFDTEELLKSQSERLLFEMENLQRKTLLYQNELIPKAEQSFTVSETAYLSNDIDFDRFMDAVLILLNLKLENASLHKIFQTTKARFYELIGKTL
ncbi:MAG: TolC family protein [Candidatus Marinimicrobia bacterium]|nr:TolC family protein [Candidatus Neomarinimicrobiota bacterium]MBL7022438.1 TolC family protein [Candidatus Neomarinimicrobiota bacterium]MBL7108707.1 TolC family protein [Candidatus Neomarinimicrobiota bacterium]